ncbi:Bug family tripartite tricarboxylate transporter substrate binding protein [Stutzerimonas tarimensis]|uniref:Bug family tripartite tricarboxylate transporter substrate binding protein n=1 Tax=Stutzerimonas tarimensis TaxID=1507735 RepID=A0ABV7TAE6_9GAMM
MARVSSTRRWLSLSLVSLLLSLGSTAALAEDYPKKSVTIVVAYPAGGATDTLGRIFADHFSQAWGQPVVVENRPGAGGITGTNLAAKAKPDGHTLLMGITAMAQGPALFPSLPYDVKTDFRPVAEIARSQNLMVVPTSLGVETLDDFLALVRKEPDTHTFGSYGNGTSAHIHGEMLNDQAKLDLRHVPYRGAAPLVTDTLAGRLSASFLDAGSTHAHLDSGRFKVLAVTGATRSPLLSEVPTFTELGYKNMELWGWFGLFAPQGTPDDVLQAVSAQARRVLEKPEVIKTITGLGLQVGEESGETFSATLLRDIDVWTKVINDAGITLN